MADFNQAVALVLKHEGGYVWNLNDPGGPTNFGITAAVYSEYIGRVADADAVKKMTVQQARDIYRGKYWQAIKGDSIASQELANHCLDMAVLRGVGAASKAMQTALGIKADGVVGNVTITALNANLPAVFLNVFRSLCIRAFAAIVVGRPASVEFLSNWCKRAEEMTETVNALLQRTSSQAPVALAQPSSAKA